MKNPQTIIARHIANATARQRAHQSQSLTAIEQADRRFWALVDRHLHDVSISDVRKAEINAGILESFRAFS